MYILFHFEIDESCENGYFQAPLRTDNIPNIGDVIKIDGDFFESVKFLFKKELKDFPMVKLGLYKVFCVLDLRVKKSNYNNYDYSVFIIKIDS